LASLIDIAGGPHAASIPTDVSAEKAKHMLISAHKNARENRDIKTAIRFHENMAKSK
jgi:hypothetical protein